MNYFPLPAVLTAIGMIVNLFWSFLNLKMQASITKQIDEVKAFVAAEYCQKQICALIHAELDRRLEAKGI